MNKENNGPKSAFYFYFEEKKNEIKNKNPLFNSAEICKEVGNNWKKMNEQERTPFYNLAKKDKERYDCDQFNKHLNQKCTEYSKELRRANSCGISKFNEPLINIKEKNEIQEEIENNDFYLPNCPNCVFFYNNWFYYYFFYWWWYYYN